MRHKAADGRNQVLAVEQHRDGDREHEYGRESAPYHALDRSRHAPVADLAGDLLDGLGGAHRRVVVFEPAAHDGQVVELPDGLRHVARDLPGLIDRLRSHPDDDGHHQDDCAPGDQQHRSRAGPAPVPADDTHDWIERQRKPTEPRRSSSAPSAPSGTAQPGERHQEPADDVNEHSGMEAQLDRGWLLTLVTAFSVRGHGVYPKPVSGDGPRRTPVRPLWVSVSLGSTLLVIGAVVAAVGLANLFVAARRPLAWAAAASVAAWLLSGVIDILGRWVPRGLAVVVTVLGLALVAGGGWVGVRATLAR